MKGFNLIVSDDRTDYIYLHSGISSTLTGSFAAPASNIEGITITASGNIISCDQSANHIFIHSGISSTITGSFAAPDGQISALCMDNSNNLLSTDNEEDLFYQHSGISTVILGSYSVPYAQIPGIVVDSSNNLLTSNPEDSYVMTYSGISLTASGTGSIYTTAGVHLRGIIIDNNENLIHMDSDTDFIYVHAGLGSVITGSFAYPSPTVGAVGPRDLTGYEFDFFEATDESILTDSFSTTVEKNPVKKVYSNIYNNGSVISKVNSAKINKTIGESNLSSSFNLNLDNYNGRFNNDFSVGDNIIIYVDKNINPPTTNIFNGILENIEFSGREQKENLILSGRDYTARLQDTVVEPESYNNLLAGSIVKDIISKYTDDITVNNVGESNYLVSGIQFKYLPVFDAIQNLARKAGYIFYVDENKDLHFEEQSSIHSGYTFDSSNVHNSRFRTKRDSVFNRVWIRGDNYLDGYKETFTAGSPLGGSIFSLVYQPHNTSITSNSVTQVGGIFNMGQIVSGTNYLVDYDQKKIIFTSGPDIGDSIPSSGTEVIMNYDRSLPVIASKEDKPSIGSYGTRVKIIIDKNIKDPVIANQLVNSELSKTLIPIVEGDINVRGVINIIPSQTCIVDLPLNNINTQTYDIIEANYNITPTTQQTGEVLKIKVNKKVVDITDKVKDLYDRVRKLETSSFLSSDILTRLETTTGSFSIRQSGLQVWEIDIGSSFVLGAPILGLLGSYTSHTLGDWRTGSTLSWSGAYF